jgi:hypothetical protein
MLSSTASDERVLAVAASLTALPVISAERQFGGGNNRLFRLRTADGASYALKEYPRRTGDPRDRLAIEFDALKAFQQCGVRDVPKAFAVDRLTNFALYEWIDGTTATDSSVADVEAALAFLGGLHAIRNDRRVADLPLASEACLAAAEIVAQVRRRLDRLKEAARSEPHLNEFLASEFIPVAETAENWSRRGYEAGRLVFDRPIEAQQRSLSPSDFGFHNAIRRADGRLVFVDFEYFGWDDPAKLVADFLQHPGMSLTAEQCERFRTGALALYGGDEAFARRLEFVYPLFGLRWCMILLNEFLPERWEARLRAGKKDDREAATSVQLDKARRRLAVVRQYVMDQK